MLKTTYNVPGNVPKRNPAVTANNTLLGNAKETAIIFSEIKPIRVNQ